ncbi:hypothetical protein [Azohydromonas australica]|uniref:hypothetical protein n=1 Tax=Azohydromonas australica TaxID=364039 RepID=UPI00048B68BF|nr:hypothetical protein [Azohydromonas australica]
MLSRHQDWLLQSRQMLKGEAMQQYETALERARRLASESEGRAAVQATWIEELRHLGYDTADEERNLALMKEQTWSAYAELSRQQALAEQQ